SIKQENTIDVSYVDVAGHTIVNFKYADFVLENSLQRVRFQA
ncbi:MAG: hypothetical protein HW406_859, partial [Candidatus Brocadiaceae bacterium]|nr:hypothetical protein [Candidatus Brocadiaceae bacterium]